MGCCCGVPLLEDPSLVASTRSSVFGRMTVHVDYPKLFTKETVINYSSVVGICGDTLVHDYRCGRSTFPIRDITNVEVVRNGFVPYSSQCVLVLNPGVKITSEQGGGKTVVIVFNTPEADQFASQLIAAMSASKINIYAHSEKPGI